LRRANAFLALNVVRSARSAGCRRRVV
jgi:hypothetical protein